MSAEIIRLNKNRPITVDEAREARIRYLRSIADDDALPINGARARAILELGSLGVHWKSKVLAEFLAKRGVK